jgi:uncharacterized membrane protein
MQLFIIVGIILIALGFYAFTAFTKFFLQEFKKEDDNVGYIEGLIVYGP